MNRKLKFDFAGFQTSLSKWLISDLMVLLIGKHLIRAVLTFSTNLTLCDSSFSAFHYPIVSQFRWSPVSNTSDRIGTDQWNCGTRWIFPRLAIGTLSLIFLYFLSSSSPVCVISSLFHRYKLSFILSYFLSLFDNVLILYCKNIPSILSTVPIFFFFLRSFFDISVSFFLFRTILTFTCTLSADTYQYYDVEICWICHEFFFLFTYVPPYNLLFHSVLYSIPNLPRIPPLVYVFYFLSRRYNHELLCYYD